MTQIQRIHERLARSPGEFVAFAELCDTLQSGANTFVDIVLYGVIATLRKALPAGQRIEGGRRAGYRLIPQPEEPPHAAETPFGA